MRGLHDNGAFYVYNVGLGTELPAQSRDRAPGQEVGDKAESFEAIVHLKEGPRLVKTLMQSKYCFITVNWSQSNKLQAVKTR